jgi:hypothetical protein
MTTRKLVLAIAMGVFLLAGTANAGVPPAAVCKDKKLKATGKKVKSLAKAFGKNIKVPNVTKLGSDISKAQSKFSKAFTKAEFTGAGASRGCDTIEDSDAIEAKVDELVLDGITLLESGPSSAEEITNAADCVQGPMSRCRVGDYLLENGEIRVVIQDVQRNLFGIGQYGGHIIDADLRRASSNDEIDNFEEFSESINIENTAHYTDINVINDGSDGSAAVIRVTGPDDLLDFLNPSSVVASFGLTFPPAADDTDLPVEISTDYILEPGENWVRVETSIHNTGGSVLEIFYGEFLNGSGNINLFQPGYGFGETLVTSRCPGAATNKCDYVIYRGVGDGAGVSYGYVHEFNNTTQFTAAGVTVPQLGQEIALVLTGFEDPIHTIQPDTNPGDTITFTRYFVIGDGTVSSILEARNKIKGVSRGTLAGTIETTTGGPAAGVEVAVLGNTAHGPNALAPGVNALPFNVVNHTVTDASGDYSLTLPPGSYNVVANIEGHPYQGGGSSPTQNPAVIVANSTTTVDITIPDSGTLEVNVSDGANDPLPAKASVVGFDPSPPVLNNQCILCLLVAIRNQTALFHDVGQDGLPFGVTQVHFIEPTGASPTVAIEPGSYQVIVSRGPEYSIDSDPITVTANTLSTVNAKIAPVIDTTGFVSGDFHVHSIASADSETPDRHRIVTMMAEGLEFFTPSDHEFRANFQPIIVAENWEDLVTTAVSNEITSFDYGHFNGWPMTIDTNQVNGGAVDHAGAVGTAGEDFPSFGNYNLTPEQIIAAAKADPGTDTVQINHIHSHFGLEVGGADLGSGLAIDTGLEPPKSSVPPGPRRLDPAEEDVNSGYFTDTFDSLEIWIGDSRGQIANNFLGQNAGDWFNLLNQGIVRTGIADSDTHRTIGTQSGTPRTMIPTTETDLTMLNAETLAATLNPNLTNNTAGKGVGTNAPMVRVTLEALTSGDDASLEAGEPNIVTATDGEVELTVHVQSPAWAEFDTIEIYRNSTTTLTVVQDQETGAGTIDVSRFGINPDFSFQAPADFTIDLETGVDPMVPGSDFLEAEFTLTFDGAGGNPAPLTEDTWFVVMVKGTDGTSKPLFPVIPNDLEDSTNTTLADLIDGNLGEDGVMAHAFTNPLFVDVDNNGEYDAPGVQCVRDAGDPHPNCVTTTLPTTTTTTTTSTTTTTL